MAQNITLMGAEYSDVPAVTLPKTGGGTVLFTDTSDADATAEDIAQGKTAYVNGVKVIGTSEGGGGSGDWIRPAEFPDLSLMDITGEVLYLSYMANEENGFCSFKIGTNSGQYTAEIGDIVNGVFVAENTYTLNNNAWCNHYFGSPDGGYKVIRVTGNIASFTGHDSQFIVTTAEGEQRYGTESGMVEAYGNLPRHKGAFTWRTLRYVQSIVVRNVKPTSLWYAFQDSISLQNIETKTWDMQYCTNLQVAFRNCSSLKHIDCEGWDTSAVTTMNGTFQNCYSLQSLDVSGWDTSAVTNITGFANACRSLVSLKARNFVKASHTSLDSFCRDCYSLQEIDTTGWNTSGIMSIASVFATNWCLREFPLADADFSAVTSANSIINTDYSVRSITVPASLSVIGAQAFANTRNCKEYHIKATTPPTLANTNAFGNMNDMGGKIIYVPYSEDHSILNAYQTATNWSTYASYMVEEDPS